MTTACPAGAFLAFSAVLEPLRISKLHAINRGKIFDSLLRDHQSKRVS